MSYFHASAPVLPPLPAVYLLFGSLPILVVAETRSSLISHALLKTVSSAAFCAGPLLTKGPRSTYHKLITTGLCLSLIGDICLVPTPSTYRRSPIPAAPGTVAPKLEVSTNFKLGILAFAAAHGAYIAAFLKHTNGINWAVAATTFAATIGLSKALGVIYPPKFNYKGLNLLNLNIENEMRPLVTGYAVIISSMLAAAAATSQPQSILVPAMEASWPWQRLLGAAMFVISDLFVAKDAFGAGREERFGKPHSWWKLLTGWGLYFWGQMVIAGTVYV